MFTGIIQALGTVSAIKMNTNDRTLEIRADGLNINEIDCGDSVAVNGVCLTVANKSADRLWFDVSLETQARTSLGEYATGQMVNLELAMRPIDRLGGHIVSGHVDGVGELRKRRPDGKSIRYDIRAPQTLMRYIAEKGSITVDGVSLAVNYVTNDEIGVNIVPHTLDHTLFGQYQVGSKVHLEVDLIARYIERLIQFESDAENQASAITQAMLKSNGFIEKD